MRSKLNKSSNFNIIYILLFVILILLLIGICIYVFYEKRDNKLTHSNESNNTSNNISCPLNHVCMPHKEFNEIIINKQKEPIEIPDVAPSRDRRVLDDPLYPPLNRTDRGTFNGVVYETKKRNINIPTKDIGDSFRQVGYLTDVSQEGEKDAGGNQWKLFGREKNRHESEFYIVPTNNNYDIKIPLTPEVVVGPRLKDVYTIPNELRFKSPLLNKGTYEFVELPKTDFADSYY